MNVFETLFHTYLDKFRMCSIFMTRWLKRKKKPIRVWSSRIKKGFLHCNARSMCDLKYDCAHLIVSSLPVSWLYFCFPPACLLPSFLFPPLSLSFLSPFLCFSDINLYNPSLSFALRPSLCKAFSRAGSTDAHLLHHRTGDPLHGCSDIAAQVAETLR